MRFLRLRRVATTALPLACLTFLVACEDKPIAMAPSATVTTVAVTGLPATLDVGATAALKATATYSDGSTKDCTSLAAWTSSDATIAKVVSGGLLTAVALGDAVIRASCSGIAGSANVRVAPIPPPPRARLSATYADGQIEALWRVIPVLFDATLSTGAGLTYRIEFGDGAMTTSATASHVPAVAWRQTTVTATLTVTDSRGRVDSTQTPYRVWSFGWESIGMWIGSPGPIVLYPRQDSADPTRLSAWSSTWNRDFTGEVATDRSMRLVSTDGAIELTGTFSFDGTHDGGRGYLRLHIRGGPDDGRTLDFYFHDPY